MTHLGPDLMGPSPTQFFGLLGGYESKHDSFRDFGFGVDHILFLDDVDVTLPMY